MQQERVKSLQISITEPLTFYLFKNLAVAKIADRTGCRCRGVGRSAWCSGNASDPISEVTVRRARLILRWVTACGQVNHLGM